MSDLKTKREKEKMLVTRIFYFPTIFSTLPRKKLNFSVTITVLSADAFNLDQSNILSLGKELMHIPLLHAHFDASAMNEVLRPVDIKGHIGKTPHQQQTAFENIVGKGEIARNEQFLLFPQCFLLNEKIVPHLSIFLTSYFYLLLNWKSPKLAYEVKG